MKQLARGVAKAEKEQEIKQCYQLPQAKLND